ncbi:hypothetical protein BT69DRAFT_1333336 [Atractiella rhizophila]|nr:hypothetical protein BT69DRAFT_1333336 [Atractiella rhizophila]
MSKPALLAVVLCGPGEELYPLTNTGISSSSSSQSPIKPFLPVGGRPILEWVLDWLLAQGVEDFLVLAASYQQQALNSFVRGWKNQKSSSPKIELQCLDENAAKEDEEGTAGVLRWADRKGLLKCHQFLLLPCDIFFTPGAPTAPQRPTLSVISQLMATHTSHHSLLTTLYQTRESGSILPERKGGVQEILTGMKASPERKSNLANSFVQDDDLEERRLIVVGDSNKRRKRKKATNQAEDADEDEEDEEEDEERWETGDEEEWAFRQGMVKRFSPLIISTSLLPTHIFLCSPRVLTILHAFPFLSSFRDQVLPLVCKMQWQPSLLFKGEPSSNFAMSLATKTSDGWKKAWERSSTWIEEPSHGNHNVPETPRAVPMENADSRPPSVAQKVMVLVWGKNHGFCRRGNEVGGYMEINRMALAARLPIRDMQYPAGVVSPDSIVGNNVVIGERVTIKRSTVGKNCNISRGAKITGCVIMENVSIGENVKLENCIVCPGARIGDKATLKDCEIEAEFDVEPETNAKNDKLAS